MDVEEDGGLAEVNEVSIDDFAEMKLNSLKLAESMKTNRADMFFELQQSSFQTIEYRIDEKEMGIANYMIQTVVANQANIWNIESQVETAFLLETDEMMDPNNFVNTGFVLNKDGKRLVTNETQTLVTICGNKDDGMLYKTYSEVDLFELLRLNTLMKDNESLEKEIIDTETILSTFEGHTIFSIYFE